MASSLNRLLAFFTYLGHDHHLRIPIRGGSWNNTSNAGVFKLNLNNVRSNANGNIGRRSAFPRQMNHSLPEKMGWITRAKGVRIRRQRRGALHEKFVFASRQTVYRGEWPEYPTAR